MGEALLVTQLDAAEIEHAILHGAGDLLTLTSDGALEQRGDDAEREMQAGAAVTNLGAGDERQSITEAGGGGGAAGALRDVFVHLAFFVWSGAEALDGGNNHTRVERVNGFPRETHAIQHARTEVLDEHVAALDQTLQHFLAGLVLRVERDRPLVVVEHREIERVGVRNIHQLTAGDVTDTRTLDLDDVGTEPGEQLRAGRT